MSGNTQYYSSSYSSVSYSSSTSSNPEGTTTRYAQSSSTNPKGTTTHRILEETGQLSYEETTYTPAKGCMEGGGAGSRSTIEDVTDEQSQRDRDYEERMEDEYAKREGGA